MINIEITWERVSQGTEIKDLDFSSSSIRMRKLGPPHISHLSLSFRKVVTELTEPIVPEFLIYRKSSAQLLTCVILLNATQCGYNYYPKRRCRTHGEQQEKRFASRENKAQLSSLCGAVTSSCGTAVRRQVTLCVLLAAHCPLIL